MRVKQPGLLLILLIFLCKSLQAQENKAGKNVQVFVTNPELSKSKLDAFIEARPGTVVYKTDLNTERYYCLFKLEMKFLPALDSLARTMGYVTLNSFHTENISEKIKELEQRIASLHYENDKLEQQLADSLRFPVLLDDLMNRIATNKQSILALEVNVNQYKMEGEDKSCLVEFSIHNEVATPNNSRVSFVNMPGVEYGYLRIENPEAGTSMKAYQGITIKYMFTRGKSYFNLGVYRAVKNKRSDSLAVNELFLINFGQDFYPKHFGRGRRKFLNLYTGYQLGGYITNRNNEKNGAFIPNLNLSFGVELFKSRHVLIDNKVNYFLPLNELNRNMRGILYQASFNFVF